ncbi:MAG: hypothetical protein ABGW69_00970 [Nanoarchaeota archaeon]
MSLIYQLGYTIPFFILLIRVYVKEFGEKKGLILWIFHFIYTILWGKFAYMMFHHNYDFSLILKPCCMVSVGVIFGAYSYFAILALLFKRNPIPWWNELSLLAPLGIILIRIGNILNEEAHGIINYATLDILGAIIMTTLFYLFPKLRKNATLFAFVFYSFWKLFVSDLTRVKFLTSPLYFYFVPLGIAALGTYVFFYRLVKKGILK